MIDPATLRLRYAAFENVTDDRIQYWLTDAGRIVTADWGEDYEPATLALAAYHMSANRIPGMTLDASEQLPAGVTAFRSASMNVSVSDAAANRAVIGGYSSNVYGLEFLSMLRRNRGGPRLVGYVEPSAVCWS
ncbi:MAG: DUF4054 domain-containing protein [Lysobacteraceae bacterium]|nr:MAG: DUF4054 domain-containing protein [Xanthomonadaceae bacterium]